MKILSFWIPVYIFVLILVFFRLLQENRSSFTPNPEDFLHIFITHSDEMRAFLECVLEERPDLGPELHNTLLELYLEGHKKSSDTRERAKLEDKIMDFLRGSESRNYTADTAAVPDERVYPGNPLPLWAEGHVTGKFYSTPWRGKTMTAWLRRAGVSGTGTRSCGCRPFGFTPRISGNTTRHWLGKCWKWWRDWTCCSRWWWWTFWPRIPALRWTPFAYVGSKKFAV